MSSYPHLQSLTLLILLLISPALAERHEGIQGVSLEPPVGWLQTSDSEAPLILMAPKRLENFHPNVNVLIQKTGNLSYDEYHGLTVKSAPSVNGVVSGYAPFIFDTQETGRRMELTFESNGYKLKSLGVWLTKDGLTYLVTGTTTIEDFPNKKGVFQKIARTLRIRLDENP